MKLKIHHIVYYVYDLVIEECVFKHFDLDVISKKYDINPNTLGKRMNKKTYKGRYYICSNLNNIPKISEEIRLKLLLCSLKLVGKDFYRPTIQDIELAYNLIRSYNISEDYFWEFINTKFKSLRWIC